MPAAGYPQAHEQAYGYADLHRAGSYSHEPNPYASAEVDMRSASPGLHRMPTSRSGMMSPGPASIAYNPPRY